MKYTQYTIVARLFPAFITALPVAVLYFFYLSPFLSGFLHSILVVKFLGEFTILAAVIFLYSQLNRFVGKLLEDLIFCDESKMTTALLLCSNSKYSQDFKNQIHAKVKNDFSLNLFNPDDELKDEAGARRRIVEVMAMIRTKTRKSALLLQHNYEYGFIRNLVGGSIFGLMTSIVNLFVFSKFAQNQTAFYLSALSAIFFFSLLISGIPLIKYMGRKYAKVLFQEYLSM